ncbi:MAG: universal stress protein [Planctomycetes bacterium]|nr:universal stress protein [Planctomycetota bacterium]
MFKHVLVPIDLSDRNERTLRTARQIAERMGSRVTLLHVVHRIDAIPETELRTFYRQLETKSKRKLEQEAQPFVRAKVSTRAVVLVGNPVAEIVRTATSAKADLIVMGSHRVRPGRTGGGFGTTSYKVGLLCQCPVLLVK